MKINNLKQTCSACPSQREFFDENGNPVYVRYRFGELTVRRGQVGESIMEVAGSKPIIREKIGGEFDGIIGFGEIEHLIVGIP